MANRQTTLKKRSESNAAGKTTGVAEPFRPSAPELFRQVGLRNFRFFDLVLTTGGIDQMRDFILRSAFARTHGPPVVVSHLNLHNYYRFRQLSSPPKGIGDSFIMIFEGIAMKLGAFLLRHEWIPDLNATDLFPLVMDEARGRSLRLFFLGADRAVVEKAAFTIEERYGPSCLVTHQHGYFRCDEEEDILARINQSRPHVLLLGMGFLKEIEFAARYRERLAAPLVWNVGGLFDFISGEKRRAPLLMRKVRLEWLFRLLLEPRRMFHRYVVLAPWWLQHIIREGLRSRSRRTAPRR